MVERPQPLEEDERVCPWISALLLQHPRARAANFDLQIWAASSLRRLCPAAREAPVAGRSARLWRSCGVTRQRRSPDHEKLVTSTCSPRTASLALRHLSLPLFSPHHPAISPPSPSPRTLTPVTLPVGSPFARRRPRSSARDRGLPACVSPHPEHLHTLPSAVLVLRLDSSPLLAASHGRSALLISRAHRQIPTPRLGHAWDPSPRFISSSAIRPASRSFSRGHLQRSAAAATPWTDATASRVTSPRRLLHGLRCTRGPRAADRRDRPPPRSSPWGGSRRARDPSMRRHW